ncbi:3-oxoacyl-[acyl-carrier-protein] reductase [Amycolatopsis sp. CA-128772]|uniref:3-oxoacyl-[acyl-carrier-protein] reductase n=1 Tax=Amycolatopsis sp. CA-128772 TaxID=2073159 RepID=UPI000CD02A9F|nr:3-oxoacyl-[acyl-carrier-protein] reductase [Amycolatopsis sp. CA-128772]
MSDPKVALVSGGSRGIGRAVVLSLAGDGHDIAFCYRADEQAADLLTKEVHELGRRAVATKVDVTDREAAGEWVARTAADLGTPDAVVTSAGITRDGAFVTMTEDRWTDVLRTNLDGVYNVCQPAVFLMLKQRRGSVVALSSVSGVYGNPTQVNYSASKSGVIGFTKALAKEVGRFGIRVNSVAPGLIETDMTAQMTDKAREKLRAAVPLGRFGTAEEVADLVAYLVSDRAAYITGSVFEIDGGLVV